MKILMLTPYLPYPPSSGGQVRSFNLIKHLGKSHKITLIALIKNDNEKKNIKKLKKYCQKIYACKRSEHPWTINNVIKSIFGKYPFLVVRNYSYEAKNILKKLLANNIFDIIHAETFYVMPHIPETKIPILLVEQTIEYKVYDHFVKSIRPFFLRPFFYYDIAKLYYWEKYFWKKADMVVTVSESDKNKIQSLVSNLKISVIPNGAGNELLSIYKKKDKTKDKAVLYIGNFSWLQNIEAGLKLANDIFPKIKKLNPEVTCIIAGQNARQKLSKKIKSTNIKIINVKNNDTQKVLSIYKKAHLFIAPISGPGGTRLKILAAMAAGLPVISSSVGVEGLSVKNYVHVLIAKNQNDYPLLVKRILSDNKLYNSIRKNARELILQKYSYEKIAKELGNLYVKLSKKNENRH